MTEIEFNEILDVVTTSMAFHDNERAELNFDPVMLGQIPQPANDNGVAWPLIPFPAGWIASC